MRGLPWLHLAQATARTRVDWGSVMECWASCLLTTPPMTSGDNDNVGRSWGGVFRATVPNPVARSSAYGLAGGR